ncbi:hypothetical protein AYO48_04490 [Gaiella sp. SCGC AG-212-M14]|nr:hypothetical protein AYO48_04490 [Gaiella sp. SCGC AG-212-M14]
MKIARLWIVLAGAILVCSGLGATAARADGLPVLGVDVGATGVATPSGQARYVTVPAGADTIAERINARGGRISASLLLPGSFTIPAVAYDGSASGLSGDGHTLVLIEPRASFPRAETKLAVLDTRPLLWRTTITLPGDFSFDAVSPNGSLLYLIQYTSALDPTKYNVRVYDLDSSRLVKAPIVDPHARGEKMRGQPLTRATSSEGRWAYTLYDGGGKAPFVHALDTSNRTARCIDLDALAGTDLTHLGLKLDSRHGLLSVTRGARPALNVDLASFQVRPPSTGTSRFPWLLTTLLAAGVLVIAAVLPSRIRRARARRQVGGTLAGSAADGP